MAVPYTIPTPHIAVSPNLQLGCSIYNAYSSHCSLSQSPTWLFHIQCLLLTLQSLPISNLAVPYTMPTPHIAVSPNLQLGCSIYNAYSSHCSLSQSPTWLFHIQYLLLTLQSLPISYMAVPYTLPTPLPVQSPNLPDGCSTILSHHVPLHATTHQVNPQPFPRAHISNYWLHSSIHAYIAIFLLCCTHPYTCQCKTRVSSLIPIATLFPTIRL